jgi:cytochrome bd-type quinol oxidase subunit 1
MQVMINFTMGLAMALVFFWFGLWSLVRDYEANPLVAALIFVGAAAAAFAYVVSYLLAIYGATAGSVYGVLKVAESTQRARIADAQQQGRVGNNAQRPHYD